MTRSIGALFIAVCLGACSSTREARDESFADASLTPPADAGDASRDVEDARQCLPSGASCGHVANPLTEPFCCSGGCYGDLGSETCQ